MCSYSAIITSHYIIRCARIRQKADVTKCVHLIPILDYRLPSQCPTAYSKVEKRTINTLISFNFLLLPIQK